MLNSDYKDMLSALSKEKADFILVGAYALAAHGLPRATGDIDLFVRPTVENSQKVFKALQQFGAPLSDITPDTFGKPDVIFQIGLPPNRIDLISSITGVSFEKAWAGRKDIEMEGIHFPVISVQDIIVNKTAIGRPKDLVDVHWLQSHFPSKDPKPKE